MVAVELAQPDEVREILRAAVNAKTDPSAQYSADDLMQQGQCWKFVEAGVIVGAMVTAEQRAGYLWVLLAGGRSEEDLANLIAEHMQRTAAGRYYGLAFRTVRAGLVRKAMRHGFEIDTCVMRKKL